MGQMRAKHGEQNDSPFLENDNFARQSLDPDAWWVGQMVGYLMRPSQKIQQFLKEAEKTIDFSTPVVGIHVR